MHDDLRVLMMGTLPVRLEGVPPDPELLGACSCAQKEGLDSHLPCRILAAYPRLTPPSAIVRRMRRRMSRVLRRKDSTPLERCLAERADFLLSAWAEAEHRAGGDGNWPAVIAALGEVLEDRCDADPVLVERLLWRLEPALDDPEAYLRHVAEHVSEEAAPPIIEVAIGMQPGQTLARAASAVLLALVVEVTVVCEEAGFG